MADDLSETPCLVFNNPNPQKGGIPRYSYVMKKMLPEKESPANLLDMTESYGQNPLQKLYNSVYGRKKYLQKNDSYFTNLNHFLQPEIYWDVSEGKDVVTIHDLALLNDDLTFELTNLYEAARLLPIKRRMKHALNNADYFIAVSQQTKDELVDYGISEDQISVVHHGVEKQFKPSKDYSDRSNIIGYLGSFNGRKRPGRLLEEYKRSRSSKGFELYMSGWGGTNEEKLRSKYEAEPGVKFNVKVPEDKLPNYYNELKALFIPTSYEGFGMPILEAVACGTPVFTYKDADISPEVKQFTTQVSHVQEALNKLDDGFSEKRLEEMSETVKERFTWEKAVEDTLDAYKEALK